jgi:hypothetical protein
LDAACVLLLAVTLLACLLLTYQTVDSWNRRRILASTQPWEVVVLKEREALAGSTAPRCDPLLRAEPAYVAWQLQSGCRFPTDEPFKVAYAWRTGRQSSCWHGLWRASRLQRSCRPWQQHL